MKHTLILALFSLLIITGVASATPVVSERAVPVKFVPARSDQRFTFDILAFKPQQNGRGPDSVRVDIYLAIPYQTLSFLYAGDKYVADYGAILQVTDAESERMVLDKYQTYTVLESVAQHEQRQERGQERADAQQFSVMLPASHDFEFHLIVRDLTARHDIDTMIRYTTPDFHAAGPSMSDLMIYRSRRGARVVPSIGPDVAALDPDGSGVFAELYNMAPDSTFGVVTELFAIKQNKDINEDNIVQRSTGILRTQPAPVDSGRLGPGIMERTPLFHSMSFQDLWMGHYLMQTYILPSAADTTVSNPRDLRKRAIAVRERVVDVSMQRGIPIVEADLDQAIEQLRIIATGPEWDSLNWANTAREKRDALVDFWRRRNPYPREKYNEPMQIFYSRVQYANEHFATTSEGWRSDRGRVYIALGEPQFIDRHPYEALQKPYEVWEYPTYRVKYYFVDQYMLGDYRLVGPPPAPGTFIWEYR